jgi:hypothetical protein
MIDEPPVDTDAPALAFGLNICKIKPSIVSSLLFGAAFPEEEDIDDHIRASVCAKAAFGQADGANRSAMPATCSRARASALSIVPDEGTKAASPPGFSRSIALTMK